MNLIRFVSLTACLLCAGLAGAQGTKEVKPAELKGFEITGYGRRADKPSATAGNAVHSYFVTFENRTKQEIASVTLRMTADVGEAKPIVQTVTVSHFFDTQIYNREGIAPGLKADNADDVVLDLPNRQWEQFSDIQFELVSVRVYEGKQDLHNLGHLYTWLGNAPEAEQVETLRHDPSLATSTNENGFNGLCAVYGRGSLPALKAMEEAMGGNHPPLPHGLNPLHFAVSNPSVAVRDYVLKAGANPSGESAEGFTPLMYAFLHNELDGARWLLGHGANPNQVTSKGYQAFQYALSYVGFPAVEVMVAAHPDVAFHDAEGNSWMHIAARGRADEKVFNLLRKSGFSVNDVDPKFGITPIMQAAKWRRSLAVTWLLRNGAKPDLIDKDGHDAYWYAEQSRTPGGREWLKGIVKAMKG